jgi:hypothetical protein
MKHLAAVLLLCCSIVSAQDRPVAGAHEVVFWTSGGRGTTGSTAGTGILSTGLRYGWVITNPHGPGPLRGTFEYAVDAVPLYLIFQSQNTYGAGVNPVVLKWNFDRVGRVAPYLELNGGSLFTTKEVPLGTSHVNFTSGAAFGLQFLGRRWNPALALRYVHISSAGLSDPNPGINTVQFTLAIVRFSRH